MGQTKQYSHDVFLSYSRRDQIAVHAIADRLKAEGLNPFLDIWGLARGQPWQEALERALNNCRAVAVFLGPGEMGSWQQREMRYALDQQIGSRANDLAVIPVLLPGLKDPSPGFLTQNTWVDLRDERDSIEFDALVAAISGKGSDEQQDQRRDPRLGVSPYRGLGAFREEDASYYFGRAAKIKELIAKTETKSFVPVLGPSGSGKSSLVYAGLLPHLRRGGVEEHTNAWEIFSLKPGAEPLKELARLVPFDPNLDINKRKVEENARVGNLIRGEVTLADWVDGLLEEQEGTDRLLLFVDQWEEIYTEPEKAEGAEKLRRQKEARFFIDQLLEATEKSDVTVVLTMRSDFLGRAGYRPLADRMEDATVWVGEMTDEEIREAIERPAALARLKFEPGLVDTIVKDLGNEPGRLPLLEFLLSELWQRRDDDGTLTHQAYEKVGGVDEAIATRAKVIYESLQSNLQKDEARRLLVDLVNPGEGRQDTRARVSLKSVNKTQTEVLDAFLDARLLVASVEERGDRQRTLEMAHEALIGNWQELRDWVNEDREFLRVSKRIRADMKEWEDRHKPPGLLLPEGLRLEEGRELLQRTGSRVEEVRNYIELSAAHWKRIEDARVAEKKSQQEREREREIERLKREREQDAALHAQRRKLYLALSCLAVALAFGAIAYVLVEEELGKIETTKLESLIGEVRASGYLSGHSNIDSTLALLLATEALVIAEDNSFDSHSAEAQTAISSALWAQREISVIRGHDQMVSSVEFDPNGTRVITGSYDGAARIWDAFSGAQIGKLEGHTDAILSVTFSPDGSRIATASKDMTARIWDAATFKELEVLKDHSERVYAARFVPDQNRILTISKDNTIAIWNPTTGEQITKFNAQAGSKVKLRSLAISPDGTLAATGSTGKTSRIWNIDSGIVRYNLRGHEGDVLSLAFSPDGTQLATGSSDQRIRIFDVRTGAIINQMNGHIGSVRDVQFDTKGKTLISVSSDKTIRFWDVASGELRDLYRGHSGKVMALDINTDGSRIITGATDHTARIWTVGSSPHVKHLVGHGKRVNAVWFGGSGDEVFTAARDGKIRIWDGRKGQLKRTLNGQEIPASVGPLLTDGDRIVSGNRSGKIIAVNTDTGVTHAELPLQTGKVISSGGMIGSGRLATWSDDGSIRLMNWQNGREIAKFEYRKASPAIAAALSPNGLQLATGHKFGEVRLWDVKSEKHIDLVEAKNVVRSLAYSADGNKLIAGTSDRVAHIWDLSNQKHIHKLSGHSNIIPAVAFNRASTRAVTGSRDGTARIWDVASGRTLAILKGHSSSILSVAFNQAGDRVVTGSIDGTARIWPVFENAQDLVEYAKSVAPRCLTNEERAQYFVAPNPDAKTDHLYCKR